MAITSNSAKDRAIEVIRCLRLCSGSAYDCRDADGVQCSFRHCGDMRCATRLKREAADLLAATYNRREREL